MKAECLQFWVESQAQSDPEGMDPLLGKGAGLSYFCTARQLHWELHSTGSETQGTCALHPGDAITCWLP